MAAVHAHPEQEDVRVEQLVRVLSGEPLFSWTVERGSGGGS
jgi:hypothetical protein